MADYGIRFEKQLQPSEHFKKRCKFWALTCRRKWDGRLRRGEGLRRACFLVEDLIPKLSLRLLASSRGLIKIHSRFNMDHVLR